tara:strand:- start:63 stop:512 length:450 start_codon:yes stop_codon:yes gene_type:complete
MKTLLTTLLLLTSAVYASELKLPLDYDERVVTMTILGEARGEGKAGMYAVACVIRKRMEERKLPAVGVCLQKKQFSCWNNSDETLFKLLNGSKEHVYAMSLAAAVIKGGLKLDYVKHANHYCTLKTHNYWTKGRKPVKVIGNHKFFKLD